MKYSKLNNCSFTKYILHSFCDRSGHYFEFKRILLRLKKCRWGELVNINLSIYACHVVVLRSTYSLKAAFMTSPWSWMRPCPQFFTLGFAYTSRFILQKLRWIDYIHLIEHQLKSNLVRSKSYDLKYVAWMKRKSRMYGYYSLFLKRITRMLDL